MANVGSESASATISPFVTSALRAMRRPEPAFIGKIAHRVEFACDFVPHRIERVFPSGRSEILENFLPIRQMHERAAGVVFEIPIAELHESRVLLAAHP